MKSISTTITESSKNDLKRKNVSTIASVIVYAWIIFSGCAPLPMVQSARVSGGHGMTVSYTTPSTILDMETEDRCIDCSTTEKRRTMKYPEQMEPRVMFRTGLANRVELSALVLPYYLSPMFLLGGNIKVALFDVGEGRLFRNVSTAIFCGGDYWPVEHTPAKAYWGGVIIGTHCPLRNNELELVFMASGSKAYYDYNEYLGTGILRYTSANMTLGCIFRPFRTHFLQMIAGVTGRIPVSTTFTPTPSTSCYIPDHECVSESTIYKFGPNPVVFQFSIMAHVADRKKRK